MTNTVPIVVDRGNWGFSIEMEPIGFVLFGGLAIAVALVAWILWKGRKKSN